MEALGSIPWPGCVDSRPVQVNRVSMRIPPLPHGPLSVRRFYLQVGYSVFGGERQCCEAPRAWDKRSIWPVGAGGGFSEESLMDIGTECHWHWGPCSDVFTTLDVARLQHLQCSRRLRARR